MPSSPKLSAAERDRIRAAVSRAYIKANATGMAHYVWEWCGNIWVTPAEPTMKDAEVLAEVNFR